MSDEFAPDLVTLTDDEGNEYDFEIIAQLEHNDAEYVAVIPFEEEDESENDEIEFMIMRSTTVDGEEYMDLVEDEKELVVLIEMFESLLSGSEDFDIVEDTEE